MPAHRSREHHSFEVATLLDQILERIPVRDLGHSLRNNRAVVENVGDIVCRCTDQLDAALVRLQVRLGSDKRR